MCMQPNRVTCPNLEAKKRLGEDLETLEIKQRLGKDFETLEIKQRLGKDLEETWRRIGLGLPNDPKLHLI